MAETMKDVSHTNPRTDENDVQRMYLRGVEEEEEE